MPKKANFYTTLLIIVQRAIVFESLVKLTCAICHPRNILTLNENEAAHMFAVIIIQLQKKTETGKQKVIAI